MRELEGQRESVYVSKPGRVPTVTEWMHEYLFVICERLVLSEKDVGHWTGAHVTGGRVWISISPVP